MNPHDMTDNEAVYSAENLAKRSDNRLCYTAWMLERAIVNQQDKLKTLEGFRKLVEAEAARRGATDYTEFIMRYSETHGASAIDDKNEQRRKAKSKQRDT